MKSICFTLYSGNTSSAAAFMKARSSPIITALHIPGNTWSNGFRFRVQGLRVVRAHLVQNTVQMNVLMLHDAPILPPSGNRMWTPHAKPKEKYIQTLELSVKLSKTSEAFCIISKILLQNYHAEALFP
jgi:hypothetical protein